MIQQKIAHRDRLPVMTGCRFADDCFSCPFDDCVEDLSRIRSGRSRDLVEREAVVYRMLERMRTPEEIAHATGMRLREVMRIRREWIDLRERAVNGGLED